MITTPCGGSFALNWCLDDRLRVGKLWRNWQPNLSGGFGDGSRLLFMENDGAAPTCRYRSTEIHYITVINIFSENRGSKSFLNFDSILIKVRAKDIVWAVKRIAKKTSFGFAFSPFIDYKIRALNIKSYKGLLQNILNALRLTCSGIEISHLLPWYGIIVLKFQLRLELINPKGQVI